MDRNAIGQALRQLYQARGVQPDDDPKAIMYRGGSVEGALLYTSLFVPDFIEVDGSVLVKLQLGDSEEKFREAKKDATWSLGALEASFNWIELTYLFAHSEANDGQDRLLAEVVAEAWRGRLKHLFPERQFVVELIPPEVTGSVWGVGFQEIRK